LKAGREEGDPHLSGRRALKTKKIQKEIRNNYMKERHWRMSAPEEEQIREGRGSALKTRRNAA